MVVEGVISLSLGNLNIFDEVGHDVGMMQSFALQSDGNVEVDFITLSGDPMVAVIEIVELTGPFSSAIEGWNMVGVPTSPVDDHYESVFS